MKVTTLTSNDLIKICFIVFGAGTACVVCPVNRVTYGDRVLDIPTMENGPELATKFLTTLNDLQYGRTRRADWQVIF